MKLWQVKGWAWLIPWACQPTGYPRGAVHRGDVAMGAGWHGHPHLILPFLLGSWPLPCWGPPGARRKMKESYLSHEIYLNLTLAFFQTGTFGGQFHSKLCCLCSSTCWLSMKHQAAKQSRHTACQAAFQGNAWAAWPQSHASQSRTVSTHPLRGETYHCEWWGSDTRDPQPSQKRKKWFAKKLRRWTAMANSPSRANVNEPVQPPVHIRYFVY